jgi:hypothetical protein
MLVVLILPRQPHLKLIFKNGGFILDIDIVCAIIYLKLDFYNAMVVLFKVNK